MPDDLLIQNEELRKQVQEARAVIVRKLSCGNKTLSGRDCRQILASIGASCHHQAKDFIQYLAPHLSLVPAPG